MNDWESFKPYQAPYLNKRPTVPKNHFHNNFRILVEVYLLRRLQTQSTLFTFGDKELGKMYINTYMDNTYDKTDLKGN